MKPGWQTTEFWVTIANSLLSFLVAIGVITMADRTNLEGSISSAIVAIGALASAIIGAWRYIQSRVSIKETEIKSSALVKEAEVYAKEELVEARAEVKAMKESML